MYSISANARGHGRSGLGFGFVCKWAFQSFVARAGISLDCRAREKDGGEDNKSGKLRVIRGQIETNGPSLFSSFLFQGTEWTKVTIVCANPSTENKTNLLRFYFQWQNANHPLLHLCCKKRSVLLVTRTGLANFKRGVLQALQTSGWEI